MDQQVCSLLTTTASEVALPTNPVTFTRPRHHPLRSMYLYVLQQGIENRNTRLPFSIQKAVAPPAVPHTTAGMPACLTMLSHPTRGQTPPRNTARLCGAQSMEPLEFEDTTAYRSSAAEGVKARYTYTSREAGCEVTFGLGSTITALE